MTENFRLLVAGRRNRQKRGLPTFLQAFTHSTGLALVDADVVDAATSVRVEALLDAAIRERLNHGSLKRLSELTWGEVQKQIDSYAAANDTMELIIFLCHHADFPFRLSLGKLAAHAKAIVEYDGDTVYATTDDLKHGIGIDIYTSDLSNEIRYTIDMWG